MEVQNRLTHYQYESEDKEAFLNVIHIIKNIEKDNFDLENSSTLLKIQDEFVKIRGESRRKLCSEYALRLSIVYGTSDWPDYHYISTRSSQDINDISIQNTNMKKNFLLASSNQNFIHINSVNNNKNNNNNNNKNNNNNNNNNSSDIINNNYNNFNKSSNSSSSNNTNTNHASGNNSGNSSSNNTNYNKNIKKRNHSVTLTKGGEKGVASGFSKSKASLLNILTKTLEYKEEFDKRRYEANLLKYTPAILATPMQLDVFQEDRLNLMDNHITLKIKELVNIINNRVALKPYAIDMNKPVGFAYISADIRGQSTQFAQNMNESPDIQSLFDSMFPTMQREIIKNNSNKKSYKFAIQKKKRLKRGNIEEIEKQENNNINNNINNNNNNNNNNKIHHYEFTDESSDSDF